MTPERFVQQQQELGYTTHRHDGVWWQRHGPFYWKPVVPYERIKPGEVGPAPWKSLAGYSHAIPEGVNGNWVWSMVMLEWKPGQVFGIQDLPSKRRNCVRRGQKNCAIRRLVSLEPHWEDLQSINVSARGRTGVGRPASFYTEQEHRWKSDLRRRFECEDRDWWGAFIEDRLVAYYHSYQVGDLMLIDTAKSHSDYLRACPNDAILFSLMDDALNARRCRCIEYGGWTPGDQPLLDFKAAYGFQRRDVPAYLRLSPVARLVWHGRRWWRGKPSAQMEE